MGTYSDVVFAMKQEDFAVIRLLNPTELPETFNTANIKGKVFNKNIYWKWNDRKWYADYMCADELDSFIDYLDRTSKEFGYINICEDDYEPEVRGKPYLFGLYTEAKLRTPF